MSEHVYEKLEVIGSSKEGIEDAVNKAVAKLISDGKNVRWFEVVETRGYVNEKQIAYWQVTIKAGCSEG